jgi:hypothetical protein
MTMTLLKERGRSDDNDARAFLAVFQLTGWLTAPYALPISTVKKSTDQTCPAAARWCFLQRDEQYLFLIAKSQMMPLA